MENSVNSGPSSSVPTHTVALQNVGTHSGTRQSLDVHHVSVSSPELQTKPSLPALGIVDLGISRTRTLPSRSPKRGPIVVPTLEGVTFDVENLDCLRRWILGLAIGNCRLLIQQCTWCAY